MPLVEVRISDLAQEPIERSRARLDPERVSYYLEYPDDASPVVVLDVGGILLLADGHHRGAAAEQLGRSTLRAEGRKGRRRDALQLR
jgi:hypothetical protein